MGRQNQISGYCLACAAILFLIALDDLATPAAECEIKAPTWAAWLCPALAFAGAGLAKHRLRGAAMGAGIVLVPAMILGLCDIFSGPGTNSIVGLAPFVAILSVIIANAVYQTIRGQ